MNKRKIIKKAKVMRAQQVQTNRVFKQENKINKKEFVNEQRKYSISKRE